jgi:pyridoxine kinase
MSSILLIGDIVGYGNLGMSVMSPILSHLGYGIYRLPSSMVSNNFCYGRFAVLDTTDYMRQSIEIWEEQGFTVDAVCTGYLVSDEQARLVADYCRRLKSRGTFIFVDPIMADDGKLYNGATTKTVDYMRRVCEIADVIVPNFTEAKFLANKYLDRESLSEEEARDLIMTLHRLGNISVVISSMVIDEQPCTMMYDKLTEVFKVLPYKMIDAQFSGTGDVFSSVLIGKYMQGCELSTAVKVAMDFVSKMIEECRHYANPDNGIPIERHFDDLSAIF